MIRAVVFDFDGVIANSEPLHFRAFRDVLADRGVALTEREYYDRYLGFDDVGAFEAIGADRATRFSAREIAGMVAAKALRMEMLEREGSVLFPGARSAVERMAQAGPVAIASGAIRAEIVRLLEHERLARFFQVIVAAEDTTQSKPAPDPYLRAVAKLSEAVGMPFSPSECVAVEDSHWGLQSARAAGLHAIGIAHTYPADALVDADVVIGHLDQLTLDLLKTLT